MKGRRGGWNSKLCLVIPLVTWVELGQVIFPFHVSVLATCDLQWVNNIPLREYSQFKTEVFLRLQIKSVLNTYTKKSVQNTVYLKPSKSFSVLNFKYSLRDACFPGGSVVESSPASAGDMGLIPALKVFPGGRNGNPVQYSCLENPMDKGALRATVHRVAKSQT